MNLIYFRALASDNNNQLLWSPLTHGLRCRDDTFTRRALVYAAVNLLLRNVLWLVVVVPLFELGTALRLEPSKQLHVDTSSRHPAI
jgi:hypothetical protein